MHSMSKAMPKAGVPPHGEKQSSGNAVGLGPNQLSWLRSNVSGFRQAEELWMSMRRETVRSARAAGVVQ